MSSKRREIWNQDIVLVYTKANGSKSKKWMRGRDLWEDEKASLFKRLFVKGLGAIKRKKSEVIPQNFGLICQ
jgi:hypothetical protein